MDRQDSYKNEEIASFRKQIEQLKTRLDAKTETILRLGKDLEVAEKEKQNFLAKCSMYERNLERAEHEISRLQAIEQNLKSNYSHDKIDLTEEIERLQREVFSARLESKELKAEKLELQKDCKLFRQQIAKFEVEKLQNETGTGLSLLSISKGSRSSHDEDLGKYEKLYSEYKQMESDLHTVLGVKEELVKERENLVAKVERLSSEMSFLLNGDNRRVTEDLDTLLAENRFLKAQLSTAHEESESIKSTLVKYRSMAESLPQNVSVSLDNVIQLQAMSSLSRTDSAQNNLEGKNSVAVVNMKQIRELLTSQAIDLDDSDLRAITTILLDVCNDKQMAITHLRRANKVLGTRLHEVEGNLTVLETKLRNTSPKRFEEE